MRWRLCVLPFWHLYKVDAIITYIKKLPNYEELIAAARETLGRYDIELPKKEAIESFQPGSIGWMRSMIDIIK